MRIGSVSGIAGRGDPGLIRPVPDAETLPSFNSNVSMAEFGNISVA